MVWFFITTLAISVVGLCGLIALKRWELSTGRVALRGVRPAVGAALSGVMHFIERIAPAMLLSATRRGWAIARTLAHRYAAWGVLWAERKLEVTLRRLRGATSTPHPSDSEASAFLLEVAKHKRKLLKRPKEDRAIHEE